ncbi:MAG TPA: methyltransferase [Thermodesulfobacteriota bacterium]|nr:methyltransferase [Thermodesulfobacteriota bacterium]
MIKSWQRKTFYMLAGPAMWINGRIYRYLRAPKKGLCVHLGPGRRCYLKGWLNVDANILTAKIDLWANLEDSLPFRRNSVRALYSFSVLEHLSYFRIEPLLREIYCCLEMGGYARIAVPHVGNAARAYVENRTDWFGMWPMAYESIGGKFENYCLCAGEVRRLFDYSLLAELLGRAGFTKIVESAPLKTELPDVFGEVVATEHESYPSLPHNIVVEVRKT